jgi:DNA-binding protein HU-beta
MILTKEAIIEKMCDVAGENATKKNAAIYLEAFTQAVTDVLTNGDSVKLIGFGTFEVIERSAREGRDPRNGTAITIAASKTPKFKPGKLMKDHINGK